MTDLTEIKKALADATSGRVEARWADPKEEPAHFVEALRLSTEHDRVGDMANTAWRLIWVGDDEDDWLNLAFYGNGPCSEANAKLAASAPSWLAELVSEVEGLRRALDATERTGGRQADHYELAIARLTAEREKWGETATALEDECNELVERCERAESALRGLLDWAERGDENATPANWTRFSEAVTRARAALTANERLPIDQHEEP